MFKKEFNYPLINFTVFLFLLYLGISNIKSIVNFFLNILSLLFPFILGFIAAYAINPFVVLLEKKMSRRWAVVFVITIFIVLLLFLFCSVLPMLYHQVAGFSIQLVQLFGNLDQKFSSLELQEAFTEFSSFLIQTMGKITFTTGVDVFFSLIHFFSQFVLSVVSFVYFLFYMDTIRLKVKSILKVKHLKCYSFLEQLDSNMICYVKSLGTFMFLQFIEYSLLFLIIGHPYWLVLGIFIGIFTVLPYIGGLISNLLALISAFMISQELFYFTLFIVLLFPIVDEYVISPRIYGKKNDIHPVLTILLLSLGGMVGGIWGIVLAIPLYLLVRTTLKFFGGDIKNCFENMKDAL